MKQIDTRSPFPTFPTLSPRLMRNVRKKLSNCKQVLLALTTAQRDWDILEHFPFLKISLDVIFEIHSRVWTNRLVIPVQKLVVGGCLWVQDKPHLHRSSPVSKIQKKIISIGSTFHTKNLINK